MQLLNCQNINTKTLLGSATNHDYLEIQIKYYLMILNAYSLNANNNWSA